MILDEVVAVGPVSSSETTAPSSGGSEDVCSWTSAFLQTSFGIDSLSLEGYVYRGEGNANIVIALPRERKVLRFRKSCPGEVSPDKGKARTNREVEFLRTVISDFLGTYVETPQILHYSPEDTARLSEAMLPLRPDNRCNKDIVEGFATKYPDYTFLPASISIISPVSKPTFCVEIKPKQGFLHQLDQQFQKCTYCLTQYYKLKSGTISTRSSYCPLDLFSGEPSRMRQSLQGLLRSPQNNLKIFKDGVDVYSSDNHPSDIERVLAEWFVGSSPSTGEQHFDIFCSLVCSALLRPFSRRQQVRAGYYRHPEITWELNAASRVSPEIVAKAKKILYFSGNECNFTSNGLPQNSVLGRIYRMQQLPYYSADVVYTIYSKHCAMLSDELMYSKIIEMHRAELNQIRIYSTPEDTIPADIDASTTESETSFVRPIANLIRNNSDKMSHNYGVSTRQENLISSEESSSFLMSQINNNLHEWEDGSGPESQLTMDQIRTLKNYLLAATAKDCSIMMTFQEFDPSVSEISRERTIEISEGKYFAVNVGVSDLDPKSVHCIEKHRQRDTNVLKALIYILEKELASRNQLSFDAAYRHHHQFGSTL